MWSNMFCPKRKEYVTMFNPVQPKELSFAVKNAPQDHPDHPWLRL